MFVSVSLWLLMDCYSVFVVEGDTHVCRKWRMFSLSALNAARSTTVWTNRLLYWTWHIVLNIILALTHHRRLVYVSVLNLILLM